MCRCFSSSGGVSPESSPPAIPGKRLKIPVCPTRPFPGHRPKRNCNKVASILDLRGSERWGNCYINIGLNCTTCAVPAQSGLISTGWLRQWLPTRSLSRPLRVGSSQQLQSSGFCSGRTSNARTSGLTACWNGQTITPSPTRLSFRRQSETLGTTTARSANWLTRERIPAQRDGRWAAQIAKNLVKRYEQLTGKRLLVPTRLPPLLPDARMHLLRFRWCHGRTGAQVAEFADPHSLAPTP
jgi:hypothetical protein